MSWILATRDKFLWLSRRRISKDKIQMMIRPRILIHKFYLQREFLLIKGKYSGSVYKVNFKLWLGFGRKNSRIGCLTFMRGTELLMKQLMEELKWLEVKLYRKMVQMKSNFNKQVNISQEQKLNYNKMTRKNWWT